MFRNFIFIVIVSAMAGLSSCKSESKSVELVYDAKAGVGEGALWDSENNRLLWIDISGKTFYIYEPDSAKMHAYPMPQEIGTVVPVNKSQVLLALAKGMFVFNIETEVLEAKLFPDIDTDLVRFNDGKCAPDGSFWVGTMHHGVSDPVAALYKVDKDFGITKMLDKVTVSNGIIWSPDGTKMYYNDSPTYTIQAFDYNIKKATISNGKVIIRTPKRWGTPDGSTIDSEGMLWVAHWGGGIVSRWNPETGELLDTIVVPAPNVTSVAFGGKNLDELYITTARNWMPEGDEEKYPAAGGLFKCKPGVKGILANKFK